MHEQAFAQIHDLIPGIKKTVFRGPVGFNLAQFYADKFDNLPDDCDTVIMETMDVWASGQYLNHPKLQNKNFFLIGIGYKNQQLNPRQYEIAGNVWYFSKTQSPLTVKPQGLGTGFSCLNNRTTTARLILGYQLWRRDLLKDIIFSQNVYGAWWQEPTYSQPTVTLSLPRFQEYLDLLPIRIENDIAAAQFANDHSVNHTAYSDAYCNIVVESEVGDDIYQTTVHKTLEVVTEKSYKPFISCQIPLILACPGHLKYLKDLGFEMMEDLLPEGFDSMGAHKKIDAVCDIVAQGRDHIENFYFDHLREIKHNHELVSSDKVEQQVLKNIRNFIEGLNENTTK